MFEPEIDGAKQSLAMVCCILSGIVLTAAYQTCTAPDPSDLQSATQTCAKTCAPRGVSSVSVSPQYCGCK